MGRSAKDHSTMIIPTLTLQVRDVDHFEYCPESRARRSFYLLPHLLSLIFLKHVRRDWLNSYRWRWLKCALRRSGAASSERRIVAAKSEWSLLWQRDAHSLSALSKIVDSADYK